MEKNTLDKSHTIARFFLLFNRAASQKGGKFEILEKIDYGWKKNPKNAPARVILQKGFFVGGLRDILKISFVFFLSHDNSKKVNYTDRSEILHGYLFMFFQEPY